MNKAFLSLGSNKGDRKLYLQKAYSLTALSIGQIQAYSSVYETEPWGFVDNNKFLNQVIKVDTVLEPSEILHKINEIESNLGRIRGDRRYSARTMDIDILFFNNQIVNLVDLQIPHPEIANRLFVLKPLSDIAPEYIHPVLNTTISALLEICKDKCKIMKFEF